MSQIFKPWANTLAKVSIVGTLLAIAAIAWALSLFFNSPFTTRVAAAPEQPVPFSHEHHVKGLGLDCRYCHVSVEKSSSAGMPPTETCMTCHSQIWADSPMLAPVRESFATGQRLQWQRVTDLPDYVYFDHSIHVQKGIGCVSCHGRVDEMPMTYKAEHLTMSFCLSCHRHPEKALRPKDKVFDMAWTAADQEALGRQLMADYHVDARRLTDCSVCHH